MQICAFKKYIVAGKDNCQACFSWDNQILKNLKFKGNRSESCIGKCFFFFLLCSSRVGHWEPLEFCEISLHAG